jgi:dynein intermediate chain 1, axonemal
MIDIGYTHEYIRLDFKYFEDKTDEIRDPMGTLFPLWTFPPSYPNRSVTALTWNPVYSDMLVIGYGLCKSFDRSIAFE